MGGSPGPVVMGETRVPKVVSLNPGTVYWMDIFTYIFVVKSTSILKMVIFGFGSVATNEHKDLFLSDGLFQMHLVS